MHLAAESHVDRSINDPKTFIDTNIIGTFNLLEISRSYFASSSKNHFKFHHISTDEVFGDLENSDELFHENTPYAPSSPYSASKASSDHLVRAWHRTYKLPVLITNCSNNYGPFQFSEKLIPNVISKAINGEKISIYGDGSQIRDWLYVDDHADALIQVCTKGVIGETYNIGGNNEKTNLQVVNEICEILEELNVKKPKNIVNFKDLIEFVEDRKGHDKRYAINSSKIMSKLNWKPKESFSSGIYTTVEWYVNNQSFFNKELKKDTINK